MSEIEAINTSETSGRSVEPIQVAPSWWGPFATTTLLLIITSFIAWRNLIGGTDETRVKGVIIVALIAALSGGLALIRSLRVAGPSRLAWITIGVGSVTWAFGALLFSRVATQSDLSGRFIPLHIGWAGLVVALAAGILMLGAPYTLADARRKLILDLMPTVIVLAVVVWLAILAGNALEANASWRLRTATAVHGLGALTLLIVAFAGALRPSRSSDRYVPRLLSLGAALLAVSDLVWLQPWMGGHSDNSVVAQVGFLAGFFALAYAVLRARFAQASRDDHPIEHVEPFAADRMQLAPYISLLVLISLTWIQMRFGEFQTHGTEIALVGSLAVVVFVMLRQGLAQRHASQLKGEIGQLTEQIDGLIEQVGRDPLTGLLNRRAVMARIDHELVHGRTFGHPLAVVLIDVDNFKTVNDTLGHQAGDHVLLAVGSILGAACRGTDVAARYAGDEFLLVLPGLNESFAYQVCQRIVDDVRRLAEELNLGGIKVTLSVGAAVTHRCKRTATQVIAIADAAMYDAKEGGKDRVVAVDADTLLQSGSQPLGDSDRRSDLTYLPSPVVRAIDDRRDPTIENRAS